MLNNNITMRRQVSRTAGDATASGLWPAMRRLVCAGVESWNRGRERRVLAELSDHLLRDIGLARTDASSVVRRVRL